IHELFDRGTRSRGEALSHVLADSLANPMYYSDMEQIGGLVRNATKQRAVGYVLVFDDRGRLLHDGSPPVPGRGRAMDDPLAAAAVAANGPLVQESATVLEHSMPIMAGNQHLGGVRVGISLEDVHARQARASENLAQRLQQVGTRHLGWLLLMLGL